MMRHVLLGICTSLLAALPLAAQDRPRLPRGPAPAWALASQSRGGKVLLRYLVVQQAQFGQPHWIGQPPSDEQVVFTYEKVRIPAVDVQALEVDGSEGGKPASSDKLVDSLRKEIPVLVSTNGENVDPFYLQLIKKGTLVLVLPDQCTPPLPMLNIAIGTPIVAPKKPSPLKGDGIPGPKKLPRGEPPPENEEFGGQLPKVPRAQAPFPAGQLTPKLNKDGWVFGAADTPRLPRRPQPAWALASMTENGEVLLRTLVVEHLPAQWEPGRNPVEDDSRRAPTRPADNVKVVEVFRFLQFRSTPDRIQAFKADGSLLSDKLSENLGKATLVLISTDAEKVDPFYTQNVLPGTMILVVPGFGDRIDFVPKRSAPGRASEEKKPAKTLELADLQMSKYQFAGELLVVSKRTGNSEIFLVNGDGRKARNLTKSQAENNSPAWSSDGKKIAFASDRDGVMNIYVMDADGGNVKNLTKSVNASRWPSWSADGKKIAFMQEGKDGPRILVMDADGGNAKQVGTGYDPALSPDGKHILFASSSDKGFNLCVMDLEGAHVKKLSLGGNIYGNVFPAWSPDGKKVAWSDRAEASLEIFVADANGNNAKQLTNLGGFSILPIWSPNGNKIAFSHSKDGGRTGTFFVMDNGGGNVVELLAGEGLIGGGRLAWRANPAEKAGQER